MTSAPRILITGATGFIGAALAKAFAAAGWHVIATARNPLAMSSESYTWCDFDMTRDVPLDLLKGVRVIVHAAYVKVDAKGDAFTINVEASRQLFALAQKSETFPVFLSSLAAHDGATSAYGRAKFAIERFVEGWGAVVRPGLVIGSGGVFRSLQNQVERFAIIPLVEGGLQPLQTIWIGELVAAIVAIAAKRIEGTFTLAEAPAISYREFFEYMAERSGKKVRFISLPGWLLEAVAVAGRRANSKFPIDRDNVRGLRTMRYHEPSLDERIISGPLMSYRQSIDAQSDVTLARSRQ